MGLDFSFRPQQLLQMSQAAYTQLLRQRYRQWRDGRGSAGSLLRKVLRNGGSETGEVLGACAPQKFVHEINGGVTCEKNHWIWQFFLLHFTQTDF